MPFSPLIGISFLFHLIFALADVAFCAWKRHTEKRSLRLPTAAPGTPGTLRPVRFPEPRLGEFPTPLRMNESSYE